MVDPANRHTTDTISSIAPLPLPVQFLGSSYRHRVFEVSVGHRPENLIVRSFKLGHKTCLSHGLRDEGFDVCINFEVELMRKWPGE